MKLSPQQRTVLVVTKTLSEQQTLTAKEAVESLLQKDPTNPTIKSLKKQGVLREILYSDSPPRPRRESFDRMESRGREGGASLKSISKRDSANTDYNKKNDNAFTRSRSSGSSDVDAGETDADLDALDDFFSAIDADDSVPSASAGTKSSDSDRASTSTSTSNTIEEKYPDGQKPWKKVDSDSSRTSGQPTRTSAKQRYDIDDDMLFSDITGGRRDIASVRSSGAREGSQYNQFATSSMAFDRYLSCWLVCVLWCCVVIRCHVPLVFYYYELQSDS